MDGDGGLGLHVGPMAMKLAIQKAKQFGIGCVIVKNAGHLGGAGYHTSLAAKEGCIGQVMYQYKTSHRYKSIFSDHAAYINQSCKILKFSVLEHQEVD